MDRHCRDISLFQLLDRKAFDALVTRHQMDKWVRSFSTWEFTCSLVTALTLRLDSYRDVEAVLRIPRSTFGDAMNERFHGFFQDLCDLVLQEIRARTPSRKVKRAIRAVLAIDSTECQVHGSIFSSLPAWRQRKAHGVQAACKIHVVYDVDGEWIDDFKVTSGRKHDSPAGLDLRLLAGKIYVFDRAYNDMDFWLKILDSGSQFVSRLKDSCGRRYHLAQILEETPQRRDGVLWEGNYTPSQPQMDRYRKRAKEVTQLRHIIYRDPETKKIFHFITSDRKLSARAVADIYKRRWAVELLFRWLKGHIDIRYLPVKSSNAVKIQIAAAVLVQLLLQLRRLKTKFKGTLWDSLRLIRSNMIRISLNSGDRSLASGGCRWTGPPALDQQVVFT